jgi:hypothetical protein
MFQVKIVTSGGQGKNRILVKIKIIALYMAKDAVIETLRSKTMPVTKRQMVG